MNEKTIKEAANYVYESQRGLKEIPKITAERYPDLTSEEAYLVQAELIKLYEEDGYTVLAPKMGLTSRAKWDQMNVDSPIVGYIFEEMVEEDFTIQVSDYIHPKVEPEIGVVLKNELKGDDLTIADVLEQIDYVFSCVEVIDSRYQNFDFTLPDVIADNTSASGAVFSETKYSIEKVDLQNEKVKLKVNGEVKVEGDGSAVLGHPAESIVWLARHLAKENKAVPAGVPIMTGGLTAAVLIQPGDEIEIEYSTLESIKIKVN